MFEIIAIIVVILVLIYNYRKIEGYNDQTGRFCLSCHKRNPNQCLRCFNCGLCTDSWGNTKCIGGDHTGPYNYEGCGKWRHGDPFSRMLQKPQYVNPTLSDCLGTGMLPKQKYPAIHMDHARCGAPVVRHNYCILQ